MTEGLIRCTEPTERDRKLPDPGPIPSLGPPTFLSLWEASEGGELEAQEASCCCALCGYSPSPMPPSSALGKAERGRFTPLGLSFLICKMGFLGPARSQMTVISQAPKQTAQAVSEGPVQCVTSRQVPPGMHKVWQLSSGWHRGQLTLLLPSSGPRHISSLKLGTRGEFTPQKSGKACKSGRPGPAPICQPMVVPSLSPRNALLPCLPRGCL